MNPTDHAAPAPEVWHVALPVPLRKALDYLPPATGQAAQPGVRVRVPFGRRRLVGVVLGSGRACVDLGRLRRVQAVLDDRPLLDPEAVERFLEAFEQTTLAERKAMLKKLKKEKVLKKKERKKLKKIHRRQLVRRSMLYRIAAAWVITVPVSALLAAMLFFTIRGIMLP
jgi:primosomal protein N'